MAKIWDALMKMLVRANPQDFVSFLTQGTCYQGDVTNELIIRSVDADFLCQAKQNEQEMIVHAEYQRRRDKNMARRLWEYNAATSFLTKLPVLSFAIYLWKEKNIATSPHRIELNGELIHLFYNERARKPQPFKAGMNGSSFWWRDEMGEYVDNLCCVFYNDQHGREIHS